MPIAKALASFKQEVAQCDSLIANAHGVEPVTGRQFLPARDREQITVAAFLNMFIAWETYLEAVMAALLTGGATTDGNRPIKFASPRDAAAASSMVIGVNRYFDYANHQNLKKIALIYFDQGKPFEPHLSSAQGALDDLRTMRNSSAHITATTQVALETLALRLLSRPSVGIRLYELLTAADPKSRTSGTIFQTHRDILSVTAELIANG